MPKISTTCIPAISTAVSIDEPTNPRKATSRERKLYTREAWREARASTTREILRNRVTKCRVKCLGGRYALMF